MIQSFGDRRTEDIWDGSTSARARQLPPDIIAVAARKLDLLNAAARLDDLRIPPGNRLEALRGKLAGFHSIRLNGQWRIMFRWTAIGPADVQIIDYH